MKISDDILRFKSLIQKTELKLYYFVLPSTLAILSSLLEGATVMLLPSLLQAILTLNMNALDHSFIFRWLDPVFPLDQISNSSKFLLTVSFVFIGSIARQIFQYGALVSSAYLVRTFADRLRQAIFSRCLSFNKHFFDATSIGYMHETVNYPKQIAAKLLEAQSVMIQLLLTVVYVTILFYISWELTLISLFSFFCTYFSLRWLIFKIKHSSRDYVISQNELGKKIYEIFSCIPLVKAYSRETEEKKNFSELSRQVSLFEFSIDKKWLLIPSIQEMIQLLSILVVLSAMVYLVIHGEGADRIAQYLVFFYIMRRTSASIAIINSARGAFATISGPVEAISKLLEGTSPYEIQEGDKEFSGIQKEIHFRHLNFSYPGNPNVLQDVNLILKRGETTALVGPSGAGKSTLVHLLLRYYDCPQGSILLDGEDIQSFTNKSLRKKMALVSQDIFLFHLSLRENLLYGLESPVPEGTIQKVLHQSRLAEFVRGLPSGLETVVGDRGIKLSGGEKQRLSIARAILKDAEILILDEATSSLDSVTERLIQEAMDELVKGKTVMVIAHRFSTIQKADKVVYLENGRVLEEGKWEGLLKQKGKVYEAWKNQKINVESL
ncbi:MAG: ABC transporter ATP-binding protein [Candidatus Omnitrophica bacterium]|nr:ABC transporter ATP-binding protein [Candidatus Omnitrophota bacterium]